MTDIITEDKNGKRIHSYIDDGKSAVIYVREDGTVTIRYLDPSKYQLGRVLTSSLKSGSTNHTSQNAEDQ
jgi:hypothetical protein